MVTWNTLSGLIPTTSAQLFFTLIFLSSLREQSREGKDMVEEEAVMISLR
jgi:hypothetical protein